MDDSLILCMEDMTQEVNLQSYLNKYILEVTHLGLSALQNWTFATIVPLLISHKIPEDDLHWEC